MLSFHRVGDEVAVGAELVLGLKILVETEVEAEDEVGSGCELVDVEEGVGVGVEESTVQSFASSSTEDADHGGVNLFIDNTEEEEDTDDFMSVMV